LFRLACLRQVEPARAPQGIRVNQDIEQAFDDGFRVAALTLDAIGVSQGQYRQAIRGISLAAGVSDLLIPHQIATPKSHNIRAFAAGAV
jgi:hypothetical protein